MTDCSFHTTLVSTRIQYLSFVIAQTCDSAKTMASLTQFFFYAEVERHQSKAWHLQSVHCSPTSIDLNREGEEWTLDMGGSKHVSFDASHFQSMSCLLYIMLWKCCIEYLVRSKDLSTEDHFVVVYKYCLMLLWWKKEYIHKEVLVLVLVKREWLQFFLEIAIATQILEFDGKQIRSAS